MIRRMLAILEQERPWIELYHEEDFVLSHAWLVNSKPMGISYPAYKYKDVRPEVRARLQARMERARAMAAVSRAVRRRRPDRAGREDLLPGAPVMAAYLVRRIGYGLVTVFGVLFLLFVLFFAVTDPDDIARKAVGERAPPGGLRAMEEEPRLRQAPLPQYAGRRRRAATPTRCCSSTIAACSPSISAAATPTTARSRAACGKGPARASA